MIGAKAIAVYKQPPVGMLANWLKLQRTSREANAMAVRTLAAAGVIMVTGTDGGNPGRVPGVLGATHVILDGSPLVDIKNTERIHTVSLPGDDSGPRCDPTCHTLGS